MVVPLYDYKLKYKREEDAYDSAHEWLLEKGFEIIVESKEPARALGFVTGFYKILQEENIQINECGIDATCKFFNKFVVITQTIILY